MLNNKCGCGGINSSNTLVGPATGTIDLSTYWASTPAAAAPQGPLTPQLLLGVLIVVLWFLKG
jgi:hypothetical protein